jgi:hypothetical protein
MKYNRKSQFFILSGIVLILGLIFIYSLETSNIYIDNSDDSNRLPNIFSEVCFVAKMSNGTSIDTNLNNTKNELNSFCSNSGLYNCNFSFTKSASAPANVSLLNYTHYTFEINFTSNSIEYKGEIDC